MQRLLLCLFLFGFSINSLSAGDFDWMIREFSRESGVEPVHIPMFGLARFFVAVARPAGTSDLHLAVFEDPGLQAERSTALMDSTVGENWKPMIRVRSRNGESTNIYFQGMGKNVRLLVGSFEHGEATLVQVWLKPERWIKFVDEQRQKHGRPWQ
jgi:hypothetical protein